jgi:hypothetical protein
MDSIFGAGVDCGLMPLPRSGKSQLGPPPSMFGRRASSFCPARFYGAVIFFVNEANTFRA